MRAKFRAHLYLSTYLHGGCGGDRAKEGGGIKGEEFHVEVVLKDLGKKETEKSEFDNVISAWVLGPFQTRVRQG